MQKIVDLPKRKKGEEVLLQWRDAEVELPPLNTYVLISGVFEKDDEVQMDVAYLLSIIISVQGTEYNWFCVGELKVLYKVKKWAELPIPKF